MKTILTVLLVFTFCIQSYATGIQEPCDSCEPCPDCILECPAIPDCNCPENPVSCPEISCPEIPPCPDCICPEIPDTEKNWGFWQGFFLGYKTCYELNLQHIGR